VDWRQAFPDDSAASWEQHTLRSLGRDAEYAWPFRTAWRYDSTLPLARDLEYHIAERYGIEVVDVRGIDESDPPGPLSGREATAIATMVAQTQTKLHDAGIEALTLYRGVGQAGWNHRTMVALVGRGLSAWTPDRAVAIGHAAKGGHGAVFSTSVDPTAVAMLFDPSSDGEVVVIGDVAARVVDIL
jgi:hypothetical protein